MYYSRMSPCSWPYLTVQCCLSHHAVKTSLIHGPLRTYKTWYGYFKHNIMYTITKILTSKSPKVLKPIYKSNLDI